MKTTKVQICMPIITDLNEIPPISHPCALSIGSFDGVHLGHQKLLNLLKKKAHPAGTTAVLTFTTHPSHLFHPEHPTPLILPVAQRLQLLLQYGVDLVIALPFTKEIAATPFDLFLASLKQHLPFDHLVLGKNAALGHKREGTEEKIIPLSKHLQFICEHIEKKENISSQEIRRLIRSGKLDQVSQALGRPYTLLLPHQEQTCSLPGICLPPSGTYSVLTPTKNTVVISGHQLVFASTPARPEVIFCQ